MRVSVIMPTSNRPIMAGEAGASVLRQTMSDFEVIVVNAGTIPPVLPDDPRVRLIAAPGLGAAAARNRGLAEAAGDFVSFLDDDDLYSPIRLAFPDVPLSVCLRQDWDGTMTHYGDVPKPPHVGQVTVQREVCPMFDPTFSREEDADWWITLVGKHKPITVSQLGYVLRDPGSQRLTRSLPRDERLRCVLRLLEKHPDYFAGHQTLAAYEWRKAGALAPTRRDAVRYFWREYRTLLDPRAAIRAVRVAAAGPYGGAGH